MKNINDYITEKLKISKNTLNQNILFPKSKGELQDMIKKEVKENGNECSLNHIDTSEITDMSYLFSINIDSFDELNKFNGDISDWDVSNVTDMLGMFWNSKFNGDLSKWDISNVKTMKNMFHDSSFNNNSICDWDVSNVERMEFMFAGSDFNQDISHWKINPNCNIYYMFNSSKIEDKFKPYKNGKRIGQ